MKGRPQARMLPDGRRLHLQHGPIDLVIGAERRDGSVAIEALLAARHRFESVLEELVGELPLLRSTCAPDSPRPRGSVAKRMDAAVRPYAARRFITPMAAVAGSVADEILQAMLAAGPIWRAYVNNGGDIALHLKSGASFSVAIASVENHKLGVVALNAGDGVGGIATSGNKGRSLSFGIADAVTVLAGSSADADAAATLIANAVDLPGHPSIERSKACDLQPDSDLGERLVATRCGQLSLREIEMALASGAAVADEFIVQGQIVGAALFLRGVAMLKGTAKLGRIRIGPPAPGIEDARTASP
ncbi:MAG: UPF0280 family protein [Hyphomicrobiaceae bacterium]|nr:MAG: UPF0280 family protein [Hyphomicrobiaceae bacterium]